MESKTSKSKVVLKKGKEKAIKNRHHWIFSGAIKNMPEFENGTILPVCSSDDEFLGYAYFNRHSSITGRMLSFDNTPGYEAVRDNIKRSISLRNKLFDANTNAYRLVNGEGDNLPGLVIDKYANLIAIQIATLGMEKLKPFIIDTLIEELSPECIYEKSKLPSRKEEGMSPFEDIVYGKMNESVEILENGIRFLVKLSGSQKTGFYLDQRQMRKLVMEFAEKKKILNCFSYTGAFTVYGLKGGALRVDSVDESREAIELAERNVKLNGYDTESNNFYVADVFQFLRDTQEEYNFIILDPPAFAKRKTDVISACRGYKDINRIALQKILPGGLLFTSSCSYYVDEGLFQKVIFQAAKEAGRNARIIQKHHLAYDHPINVYHPEGNYLKGFLVYVE